MSVSQTVSLKTQRAIAETCRRHGGAAARSEHRIETPAGASRRCAHSALRGLCIPPCCSIGGHVPGGLSTLSQYLLEQFCCFCVSEQQELPAGKVFPERLAVKRQNVGLPRKEGAERVLFPVTTPPEVRQERSVQYGDTSQTQQAEAESKGSETHHSGTDGA